ncbi:MAG: molybdopterin cofactor-binding domain-containing protein, partial [Bacteroidota bacterium]
KKYHQARYVSPFQTNACMEPLNAVAHHNGYKVEIWAGTQSPKLTRNRIAELCQLPEAAVIVHNQPSGGGFGRRFFVDYVEEAVILSEKLRRPVKVTWSREDDIQTNKYHPLRVEFWEAALDENNYPIALSHHGVVQGPSGFRPYPYALPLLYHPYLRYKEGDLLPRSSWRSVGAHPWGLGLESFIDELAHLAKKDPVEFRLELLRKNDQPLPQKFEPWVGDEFYPEKMIQTLELAAEKAKWGQKLSPGIFQGVSAMGYNTSYCAQVADISVSQGKVKVHKVTAAIHCGLAVNPSQVKSQVEGSIIWGLSALMKDPIRVRNGRVEQDNFHQYDLLRMPEAPEIEVYIVDSEEHPTGVGEPAVPGVAPAVLNALYQATGIRWRELPLRLEEGKET